MARNEEAQDPSAEQAPAKQLPRYRLTEKAYINDVLYEPRESRGPDGDVVMRYPEVSYAGVPGPHMEPLNAAAKKMCEEHKARMKPVDPIHQLSVLGAPAPPAAPGKP